MRRPRYGEKRVQAAVDDGMVILRFSALMATKNRLIVAALRDGETFDRDRAAAFAREELGTLASEQRDNAAITEDALARAKARTGNDPPQGERDYRRGDVRPLAARSEIYQRTAENLLALRDDEAYVDALVEDARRMAWEEIGDAVSSRLADAVTEDEGYGPNRELRLRYLKEVDLRMLERERRAAAQDD